MVVLEIFLCLQYTTVQYSTLQYSSIHVVSSNCQVYKWMCDAGLSYEQDAVYGVDREPDVHVLLQWILNEDTGVKFGHYDLLIPCSDPQRHDTDDIVWLPTKVPFHDIYDTDLLCGEIPVHLLDQTAILQPSAPDAAATTPDGASAECTVAVTTSMADSNHHADHAAQTAPASEEHKHGQPTELTNSAEQDEELQQKDPQPKEELPHQPKQEAPSAADALSAGGTDQVATSMAGSNQHAEQTAAASEEHKHGQPTELAKSAEQDEELQQKDPQPKEELPHQPKQEAPSAADALSAGGTDQVATSMAGSNQHAEQTAAASEEHKHGQPTELAKSAEQDEELQQKDPQPKEELPHQPKQEAPSAADALSAGGTDQVATSMAGSNQHAEQTAAASEEHKHGQPTELANSAEQDEELQQKDPQPKEELPHQPKQEAPSAADALSAGGTDQVATSMAGSSHHAEQTAPASEEHKHGQPTELANSAEQDEELQQKDPQPKEELPHQPKQEAPSAADALSAGGNVWFVKSMAKRNQHAEQTAPASEEHKHGQPTELANSAEQDEELQQKDPQPKEELPHQPKQEAPSAADALSAGGTDQVATSMAGSSQHAEQTAPASEEHKHGQPTELANSAEQDEELQQKDPQPKEELPHQPKQEAPSAADALSAGGTDQVATSMAGSSQHAEQTAPASEEHKHGQPTELANSAEQDKHAEQTSMAESNHDAEQKASAKQHPTSEDNIKATYHAMNVSTEVFDHICKTQTDGKASWIFSWKPNTKKSCEICFIESGQYRVLGMSTISACTRIENFGVLRMTPAFQKATPIQRTAWRARVFTALSWYYKFFLLCCTVLLRYTTVRYSSAIEKMIKTVQIEYGLDVCVCLFMN